jgi:GFO/IDH/MocA oxidoreductase family protein
MRERIPIGIVGAGRSRDGLGPFLARFCEEEGFWVTGVSGRSLKRARVNAQTLGQQLGHEVTAFASAAALCGADLAALVIASPVQFHLEALQAATKAGVPTLCEKPLVHENQAQEGAEVIETFARQRVALAENCQWPYMLPAFFELHGPVEAAPELRVEMGLGPPRSGREMVQNTVPHLLSVIQAVTSLDSNTAVTDVSLADPAYKTKQNVLHIRLVAPGKIVEGLLHLQICTGPPRPAWLAINGRRIDRRVGQGYAINFFGNSREVAIEDPTRKLVKHFAQLVRGRDSELIDHDRDQIAQRFEWYRQILNQLQ